MNGIVAAAVVAARAVAAVCGSGRIRAGGHHD